MTGYDDVEEDITVKCRFSIQHGEFVDVYVDNQHIGSVTKRGGSYWITKEIRNRAFELIGGCDED